MSTRPRVAINAQLLSFSRSYRSGGISRYIYHLLASLSRLEEARRQFALSAYVADPPPAEAGLDPAGLFVQPSGGAGSTPLSRIAWEQTSLPWLLRRAGTDLLHATGYVAPLAWAGPLVVTVCDLSFYRFPEVFNRGNRLYLQWFTRISARRAQRVLTISEHTRRDVIELLGLPPEKVVTAHCGVDSAFRRLPRDEVEAYRARRNLPARFILYLGTLEPRKNVPTLLRAYAALRHGGRTAHRLVLAGAPGWQYEEIFKTVRALDLSAEVLFLGFLPAEEQTLCYNAADLFVYPSLYEGFGLPVAEAMACGTPVVASNASSLPEVVGQAGLQVDPLDEKALADAMEQALTDQPLHEKMSVMGENRARRFSWEDMAARTLEVYAAALSGSPLPVR